MVNFIETLIWIAGYLTCGFGSFIIFRKVAIWLSKDETIKKDKFFNVMFLFIILAAWPIYDLVFIAIGILWIFYIKFLYKILEEIDKIL